MNQHTISSSSCFYHRFPWYATFENKTVAETFPLIIHVIDRSDRNPPITACYHDKKKVWRSHLWLTEIMETFPRVFCFSKSRINENSCKYIEHQLHRNKNFPLTFLLLPWHWKENRENIWSNCINTKILGGDCFSVLTWVSNRPFAGSGHMVRNKLHWDANNAVGLPKQRNLPIQPDFPLFW